MFDSYVWTSTGTVNTPLFEVQELQEPDKHCKNTKQNSYDNSIW